MMDSFGKVIKEASKLLGIKRKVETRGVVAGWRTLHSWGKDKEGGPREMRRLEGSAVVAYAFAVVPVCMNEQCAEAWRNGMHIFLVYP